MRNFKKINEDKVICEEGFYIKISHKRLLFNENGRPFVFDVEHLVNPYKLIIYKDTVEEKPIKYNFSKIDSSSKKQMLEKISDALGFMNIKHEFE